VGRRGLERRPPDPPRVKDRKGDQRGGSEWELIKILLEGD
jgi:hypothetical protein